MNKTFSLMPQVTLKDYDIIKSVNWQMLDAKVKEEMGFSGIAIPSVRVGICWILEFLGYARHKNHILVPKYLSRCILNAVNRYALPVEKCTEETTALLSVEQFGFRQNEQAIVKEAVNRRLVCIEDNASSIGNNEVSGDKSLARVIGFSKVLPILKGGFLISQNQEMLGFIKKKRTGKNPGLYSWFIATSLAALRRRIRSVEYSSLADLAYESYLSSPSDNRFLLNNFWMGIDKVKIFSGIIKERMAFVLSVLADKVLYPESARLSQVLLLPVKNKQAIYQEVFARNNFDNTPCHFDTNRNVFNQQFEKCMLIPLNPNIPQESFNDLINQLGEI